MKKKYEEKGLEALKDKDDRPKSDQSLDSGP